MATGEGTSAMWDGRTDESCQVSSRMASRLVEATLKARPGARYCYMRHSHARQTGRQLQHVLLSWCHFSFIEELSLSIRLISKGVTKLKRICSLVYNENECGTSSKGGGDKENSYWLIF